MEQLAGSLQKQAEELSRQQALLANDRNEIVSRQAELQLAREQLAQQHREMAERERGEREQLDHRAAELEVAASKIKQAERALTLAQEEHQSEVKQLAARRARLDEQQLRVEKELEDLDKGREDLRNQRSRIAQQFKVERTAMLHERELGRAEIDQARGAIQKNAERSQTLLREDREAFEQEMARARQQLKRDNLQSQQEVESFEAARQEWGLARQQLEKRRDEQSAELFSAQQEIQRLNSALANSQRAASENRQLLDELKEQHEALRQHVEKQAGGSEADNALLSDLRGQVSALTARAHKLEGELADAEKKAAAQPMPENAQQVEDLRRRFEMAVDDVRQLKRRNAELEETLAAQKSREARHGGSAEPVMNWEATKRKLMAQLQDDGEQFGGNLTDEERLTVEGAIRITDGVVIQRDREIAELKQQLADRDSASEAEAMAAAEPAAAAIANVLDADAVIREERQRLLAMQNEWQDKLRQAEVEISVQRAKLRTSGARLMKNCAYSRKKCRARCIHRFRAEFARGSQKAGTSLARAIGAQRDGERMNG